jgi:hypothetical protein
MASLYSRHAINAGAEAHWSVSGAGAEARQRVPQPQQHARLFQTVSDAIDGGTQAYRPTFMAWLRLGL